MSDSKDVIDPLIRTRIEAELCAIEREHGVQILLAVESGSRAWGFPSLDSDYDVRFLFLQPIEKYLAVDPGRDVIERPIDATLDVSGWDLRKAFQLLLRSNAILVEWLTSPVRYRDGGDLSARIWELVRTNVGLSALAYHYDHQARRSFEEITAASDHVRFKTYCYALRAALALSWLRHRAEPPPMNLPSLLEGLDITAAEADSIAALVSQKSRATERDTTSRIPTLDRMIGAILADPMPGVVRIDRQSVANQANALFASIVLDQVSSTRSPEPLASEGQPCS
jgi:predicted nucleotidyltransferase